MIHGKFAKIRWIPRPLEPLTHPSPFPLPFHQPSLPHSEPGIWEKRLCLAQPVWQQEGEGAGDSEEEEAVHRAGKCCMPSSETASKPGGAGNLLLAGAPSLGCLLASAAGAWSLKRAEWDEKHHWQSRWQSVWWKQLGVQLTKMQQQETNNLRGKPAKAKPRLQNSLTLESNMCHLTVSCKDSEFFFFLFLLWIFQLMWSGLACKYFSGSLTGAGIFCTEFWACEGTRHVCSQNPEAPRETDSVRRKVKVGSWEGSRSNGERLLPL